MTSGSKPPPRETLPTRTKKLVLKCAKEFRKANETGEKAGEEISGRSSPERGEKSRQKEKADQGLRSENKKRYRLSLVGIKRAEV